MRGRVVPQSYYELEAAVLKFRFPVPGMLDGITSREKHIVKLTKVGGGGVYAWRAHCVQGLGCERGGTSVFRVLGVSITGPVCGG